MAHKPNFSYADILPTDQQIFEKNTLDDKIIDYYYYYNYYLFNLNIFYN